mmetsp:Transcript_31419/g.92515  ORF Transcript_31419/g.92515 Transcript_31419/m.92515 type:complete len:215 (+) Transcript_31419:148-792(+)
MRARARACGGGACGAGAGAAAALLVCLLAAGLNDRWLPHEVGEEVRLLAMQRLVPLLQLEAEARVLRQVDVRVVVDQLQEIGFPPRDLRDLHVGDTERLDEVFVPDRLVEGELCGDNKRGQQARLPVLEREGEAIVADGALNVEECGDDARVWQLQLLDDRRDVLLHRRRDTRRSAALLRRLHLSLCPVLAEGVPQQLEGDRLDHQLPRALRQS